ncbi:MAG: endonuclease/exonuclease/phosphatase family protein [Planctomycetes bacterium]|nr:endonuclease/exonuclease/phosphatase family protein [Planctomycetota bacterium]
MTASHGQPGEDARATNETLPPKGLSAWAGAAIFMAGITCAGTILGFFGRWGWVLELFSHFRPHYSLLLATVIVPLALARRWKTVVVVGCFAAINFVSVLSMYVAPSRGDVEGVSLRCVLFNVNTANVRHADVAAFLQRSDADVIMLLETDDIWLSAMREALDEYPYSAAAPRKDNFGIGLFSKLPIVGGIEAMGAVGLPAIRATLIKDGCELTLVGVHAVPPKSAEYAALRNDLFDSLAGSVPRVDGPVVLLGDLNATPWSPYFHDLLARTGLSDGRRGFGIKATWPSFLGPFGIPIDHCLVSDDVIVEDFQLGPSAGSDHRAVVVDLLIRTTNGD